MVGNWAVAACWFWRLWAGREGWTAAVLAEGQGARLDGAAAGGAASGGASCLAEASDTAAVVR